MSCDRVSNIFLDYVCTFHGLQTKELAVWILFFLDVVKSRSTTMDEINDHHICIASWLIS
jgi:hypothetical protein